MAKHEGVDQKLLARRLLRVAAPLAGQLDAQPEVPQHAPPAAAHDVVELGQVLRLQLERGRRIIPLVIAMLKPAKRGQSMALSKNAPYEQNISWRQ